MNISYVTTYDAHDIQQWSGTGYYIAKALEQQNAQLDYAGNLNTPVTNYLKFKKRIYGKLGKRFLTERVPWLVRSNAIQAEAKINPAADIIFSPSTLPISLIETKKPKVFYTDATFAGMLDFYPYLTNVCAESIAHGNALEQAAFDSCDLAIYSSGWAAQSAIDNYKVNPEKIKVVPFGANIICNRKANDIEQIIMARDEKTCHLFFLGVEWDRKGGDMALQVTKLLNQIGLPTILHIAGIREIPVEILPSYVQNHGFLNKNTDEGTQELNGLFNKSHFLIMPTKADCTPVVYAEANSFGLPCLSTNVGGTATLIHDNVNGKLFALSDAAEKYAAYIENCFTNRAEYQELCRSSFNEYETRLNWQTAGKSIMDLLKAV
jgi:glycosyltransferase involved in cell wall biosynthesis